MSTIYLVDDHAILREGLGALLEMAGHAVVGESGTVSRARAELVLLRPDVLLLDLELRGHSGLELLAELQPLRLRTRAIVLPSSGQAHHVAEAVRLGAAGYLLKGAPGTELIAAVAAVAAGRRHYSARVDALARGLAGAAGERALSARERSILVMVARGQSSAAIGRALGLSSRSVETSRNRLMSRLRLADVQAVVRWAIRMGLVGLRG
jgi:two-component system invasion response regulator UvrY